MGLKMELIRLYYNSIDIKPSVLIRHFARYLGLYVEENPAQKSVDNSSLADIYIISDEYFGEKDTFLDVPFEDKTILVLKDGYRTDDTRVKAVYYNDGPEKMFLEKLFHMVCDLVVTYQMEPVLMTQRNTDYIEIIDYVIDAYVSNNIMQASLFNRCFYKEKNLYQMAINKYKHFISDIDHGFDMFRHSDLLEYVLIYAKYEINLICKKNIKQMEYLIESILDPCEDLLGKHPGNEELYLLKADIQLELQDRWLWACDDFAESRIAHCAYAQYKRGKIFNLYLEEYDNAEYLLKRAVRKKKDYVYAWYQLGVCYDAQARYHKAIEAFDKILDVLRDKYFKNLLAPMEMEYMYKAAMRIAVVYKTRLGDYVSAYAYNDFAESIRKKNSIKGYVEQIWDGPDKISDEDAFQVIDGTLKNKFKLKLEEIY